MFLRATKRIKNGKEHHYYSVVENRRLHDGKTVQKTVLYLGEINDAQRASWCEAIEVSKGGESVGPVSSSCLPRIPAFSESSHPTFIAWNGSDPFRVERSSETIDRGASLIVDEPLMVSHPTLSSNVVAVRSGASRLGEEWRGGLSLSKVCQG